METLAHRVVRRFLGAVALAKTLPEYIRLVAEDTAKVTKWKTAFVANSKRSVAEAHKQVLASVRGDPSPAVPHITKDANKILAAMDKALDEIGHKLVKGASYELEHAFHDEHNEWWDPEMFADGQTKADYAPKHLDPLFNVCIAVASKYREFWTRFLAKWDFGKMNVTMDALLPAEMKEDTRINMQWLKDVQDHGLDVAFTKYLHALEALLKKVGPNPAPPGGSAHSVKMGLSSLIGQAKEAGDSWSVNFAHSLWDQLNHGRQLTDGQRNTLDKKLHEYGIPAVNYNLR